MTPLTLSVCLSTLLYVAAFSPHEDTFRYKLVRSLHRSSCLTCLGDNCWELPGPRCQYYVEASTALGTLDSHQTEEPSVIEPLIHDMMQQGAASWFSQDCIPYISQYTDCDKDNICSGCKTCACDGSGHWICQPLQRCRAEPELNVDHHVLMMVLHALKKDIFTRRKRFAEFYSTESESSYTPRQMDDQDVMRWLYNLPHEAKGNGTKAVNIVTTTLKANANDTNYVDFNKDFNIVMGGMQTDKQNTTKEYTYDYMDLDDVVMSKYDNIQYKQLLNGIEDRNDVSLQEESTKYTLNVARTKIPRKSGITDFNNNLITNESPLEDNDTIQFDAINIMKRDVVKEIYNDGYNDRVLHSKTDFFQTKDKYEQDSEKIQFDAAHIMKRDILSVSSDTNHTNVDTTTNTIEYVTLTTSNETNSIFLTKDVINPLSKVINDKEQEIKSLLKIRDNLITFMNTHNKTLFNYTYQDILNATTKPISEQVIDFYPEIQSNLRKISPNSLDKLLYKLKRDIYEVIKDVVGLKKITDANDIPQDLKDLIKAMGVYVHKQKNSSSTEHNIRQKSLRRLLDDDETNDIFNSTKDYLIKIFEILDKDKPKSEALLFLSRTSAKIIKRVIKNNYHDDFAAFGSKLYEPGYNFTDDMKDIGKNWQYYTANLAASKLSDKLYAIKQLHLCLSSDINKLTNIHALIDFADTRRMIPLDGDVEERMVEKVLDLLTQVKDKVILIFKYYDSNGEIQMRGNSMKDTKKKSFLRRIKNLIKGSSKDITDLIRQKIPRKNIVHSIAKKKLEELSRKDYDKYQDTLRKWQSDLNVISRSRRSSSRMNKIIPEYLKGKLNPAIAAKRIHQSMQSKKASETPQVISKNISKKATTPRPDAKVTPKKKKKKMNTRTHGKNVPVQTKNATIYHLNGVEILKPQILYKQVKDKN